MKRTKIFVLAVAMAFGFTAKAYAFPANKEVLVIGNRAYDVSDGSGNNIISGRFTDSDFLNYVADNNNNIYYVTSDSSGNATIKDVFDGGNVTESDLINRVGGKLSYYSGTNTTPTDYWVTENGQYKASSSTSSTSADQYITLEINPKQITGNLYLMTFKVDQVVGVPGAAFYTIGTSNKTSVNSSASCMVDTSNIGSGIPIYIYASDNTTKIADAYIQKSDISDANGNTINSYTIKTIKFNNVINPITPIATNYTVLGNMSNGGLITSDSNYIYYVNTGDGNKIYKKNTYGTENFPICDDKAGYITAYGDWIYYTNYSDNGKIYKVKTDGTLRQKISDNKGTFLNVIDDKIYYVNGSDGGRIYSLDSAGNSSKLSSDEAYYLELGPGNNLFFSNQTNGKNLYKIDGMGNEIQVDNLGKSNPASYINVSVNSSVAYYSSTDGNVYRSGDPYNPIKINIQTKSGLVSDKIANINISNSTIYYKSLVDNGKLYKVGTSGGVGQKVVDDTVDGIFVYPNSSGTDDVYYTKSGKLYLLSGDSASTTTKGIAVTKPKNNNKVARIDPISTIYANQNDSSKTIDQIDVLSYLPDKVSAIMSDGSINQLPVSWDLSNPKYKSGVYTYNGTVVGYGTKITANLALGSYAGIGLSNITADNEIGKNDTVTVAVGSLPKGDIVTVYDPNNPTKVLKSATVDSTGGVVIGGLNFGSGSGTVKVTVTVPGKAEGQPIYVPFGPERDSAPIISDYNFAATTLSLSSDGTTTTIKNIQIVLTNDEQFYVGNCTDSVSADNDSDSNWISVTNPGSYGYWNSMTNTLTINSVTAATSDLNTGGNGKKIFIRKTGTPASMATAFVINPRIPAPYGISFDETFGVIRGTNANEEYSVDGGTTWSSCTSGTTIIGIFPDIPVRVRTKATKSTLASQETLQVKVTDMAGNNQDVAITSPADVSSDGTITNNNNNIELKSSVPVTWSVQDTNGQSTTKAYIRSIDNQTAELTGYENGVVKVVATSTDGNNLQGSLNVNITNQPVITVANTTELNNAITSGARVIKLLGIGGNYQLNSLSNLNNGNSDLTIIGQDATSVINVTETDGGNFAQVGSGFTLNLKNLTIKGADSSSVGNVIDVTGGTLNLDGIYFDSLKSNSGGAIGINQSSGTVNINNCRFLPSNTFTNAVVLNNGKLANSLFTGNSNNSNELGAVSASGSVLIEGNTFTNYKKSNTEYAIKLADGFDVSQVGGVQKDFWNIINNSNIGIWLNNGDKNTLMSNNSIDITNTVVPVKTTTP